MMSATPRARATGRSLAKLLRPIVPTAQSALPRAIGTSASGAAASFSTRASSHALPSLASRRTQPFSPRRGLATVARSDAFANITSADVEAFAKILPSPSQILTTIKPESGSAASYQVVDPSELDTFNNDWMNKYHGKSQLVLKPKTTKEVSEIMKYCHGKNIAVVPQGGNTGLVGGGVPVFDEVVIQLGGLNQIRSFDEVAGTLVCDAGCILESLDNYIAEKGYMMPLDLGAKGSCHIGGNVATNAGGLRFLRYGSLHGNVLGLEVVLPDGTIMDNLSTLRKDNTGFDLKQLFIGSEGTIGLITGVSITTPRRPSAVNVAVFALDSYEAVQTVFGQVKKHCGEILSAFEFFDQTSFDVVQKHATSHVRDPFEARHPFYVLIETSGSNKDHDDEKLQVLLEHLMEEGMIQDGVLAQDETQLQGLWALRESIPEAAGKMGKVFKYDLSMPINKMYELVLDMRKRFDEHGVHGEDKDVGAVCGYGHIGDGNLHINIVAKSYDEKIENIIEPYIYEWTSDVKGSVSAEHGLGLMKATKIGYSKTPESIEYMKKIKDLFDPKGILNPYKYIQV
ncbi:probable DLD2 - D-lactate dehydrogenase [Ustilago trichophora]|uniref:Probable DLD2 - D-lactate dehydrogenase n=1 Tax=Ustilago trichophora TaxID=86804 RepID=A0A5C3DTG9_9BASI|nr:probable DLD2 - D-lactate dehydrogenase [Ustilago trichophora]